MENIKVILSSGAKKPMRATKGAGGFDVFSCKRVVIKKGEMGVVDTGVSFEIPEKYFGNVRPRSGLAREYSVFAMDGVIDSDFRGVVKILLINHGSGDFVVEPGMRVAQILFTRVEKFLIVESEELTKTERGEGGFGYTGNY